MDTLHRHSVVDGCTAATDRPMSLKVNEIGSSSLSDKLVLKIVVIADPEGNVHARTEACFDVVDVVSLAGVDVVVEERGAFLSLCLHRRNATLLQHVGYIEATHVDGPARGCVVEGVRCLRESIPVAEKGSVAAMASNQVVPHDAECQSSRTNVLLSARIDHSVPAPIDGPGAEVGRHIADEDLTFGYLVKGERIELNSLNCLIVAVVEEFGVRVNVPGVRFSHSRVSGVFVISDLVGCAVLLGLFDSALGPCACRHVVRTLLLSILEQVVADSGELERSSTLEHKDCEVVRDSEELFEIGAAFFGQCGEGFASMTHFHDAHASAFVVHELGLSLGEDGFGKAARAS